MKAIRRFEGALALGTIVCLVVTALAIAQQPRSTANSGGKAKSSATPAKASTREREEQAIKAVLQEFKGFYGQGKAKEISALFIEDGILVDSDGVVTRGRSAILEQYAAGFAEAPGVQINASLDGIRFWDDNVASVEGTFHLTQGEEQPDDAGNTYNALLVRRDGAWKFAEIRDYPLPEVVPESNYERLRELEWMIGDWVDESGEAKITSAIRWAHNKNFIVRDFSIEIAGEKPTTGTMWLGWDPQSGQIKSWVFDSGGGHGEAYWTKIGDGRWMLRARGVARDGQPNSATQTITLVNNDVVRQSSIDRIIAGEVMPDISEVVMVRRPPPALREPTPQTEK